MNTIARLLLTLPLVIPAACRDSSPATLTESPRRMSASSIEWHGLLGRGGDRVYSLAGRGVIGIPFLASAELHEGLDEFVRSWLEAHPVAVVVPVESYPFFSESTHFVYAWVSDDQAHLNLELVEGGYCRASLMVPTLRVQDRLVSPGEVDDFLKRIVEAETRAAAARAGIWEAASPEKRAEAGSIPPLGSAALSDIVAEAKAAAAEADPPPPSYDESTAEGELIRVADGDDPASSYAAFNELLRRAVDDSLSNAGFDSLVAKGLERQADSELAWSGHYAALLQVAHSQGKLSEADVRRYASHFLRLRIGAKYVDMSSWPEERRLPPVRLEVGGEHRGGFVQEFYGKTVPPIPMFAIVHVSGIALDEAPVAMLDLTDTPQSDVVLYHNASGMGATAGRSIRLAVEDSIAPGKHVLTGRIEIVVKQGAHSRRAGENEEAPVILSRQEQIRVTFDVPSP